MAKIENYIPFLFEWEGIVYEDETTGTDQPTKFGIIVDDLKSVKLDENHDGVINKLDVKALTKEDAIEVIRKLYWNVFKADTILSQSVAEAIVDFAFNCGNTTVAKKIQNFVNVDVDGIVGKNTIFYVNQHDPHPFFDAIQKMRKEHYYTIVQAKPSNAKYLNGWLNRVNALKFKS